MSLDYKVGKWEKQVLNFRVLSLPVIHTIIWAFVTDFLLQSIPGCLIYLCSLIKKFIRARRTANIFINYYFHEGSSWKREIMMGRRLERKMGIITLLLHVINTYYIQLENFWSPNYPIIVLVNTNIWPVSLFKNKNKILTLKQ